MSGEFVAITFKRDERGLTPLFDGKPARVLNCAVTSAVSAPAIVRIDLQLPDGVQFAPDETPVADGDGK